MNIFQRRVEVWHDTKRFAKGLKSPPSVKVHYDPSVTLGTRFDNTRVVVCQADTLDAGLRMQQYGLNPLLLNFSDDNFSLGYVAQGSGAQEESIARRSAYCNTLSQSFYPLGNSEAIYSPSVTVFKESENSDWAPCAPFTVALVACPAIKRPECPDGHLSDGDALIFTDKVRLVLQVAYTYGHDSLVLGAWGTGAWGMPVEDVAAIFKTEVERVHGVFKEITFAIMPAKESYVRAGHGGRAFDTFNQVIGH